MAKDLRPAANAAGGTTSESISEVELRRNNYNRVVRQSRLVTIFLSKAEFDVKPEAQFAESNEITKSYNSEVGDIRKQDDAYFAEIKWQVLVKKSRTNIVKCSAIYTVMYDSIVDAEDDIVKLFIESVARPAVYAYFRALYAHLDWSADLRSPPLPMVKFQPKI